MGSSKGYIGCVGELNGNLAARVQLLMREWLYPLRTGVRPQLPAFPVTASYTSNLSKGMQPGFTAAAFRPPREGRLKHLVVCQ